MAKQPHQHDFSSIKVVKIIADNPKYSIAKHGTKSFIVRFCSCGDEQAIDYVPREEAQERIESIINS